MFTTLLNGGSAGAPAVVYAPDGTTFDPVTMLSTIGATLGANGGVDTSHMIASWWVRASTGASSAVNSGVNAGWSLWLVDIWGNFGNGSQDSEGVAGVMWVHDNASTFATQRLNVNNATGGGNDGYLTVLAGTPYPAVNDVWTHFLWVTDVGQVSGSKKVAYYINGVKQAVATNNEVGTGAAFNIAINDAGGWGFNVHSASGIKSGAFGLADFFLDTHTSVASGVFTNANTLDAAFVAKFYNAGPVNPGADGSTPLGSQPEIFFSGDKAAFATNKGSATGVFALANPISTSVETAILWTEPYGPAGAPTDRPYYMWSSSNNPSGTTTPGSTNIATTNSGHPIAVGDLLILTVFLGETSVNIDRAITTPSGWTLVTAATNPLPYHSTSGSHPINVAYFYRVADGTDVTASGSIYTNSPVPTYTATATSARTIHWELSNYRGANATTPIQASDGKANISSVTAGIAPTVTATSAPATLVTLHSMWSSGTTTVNPGTGDLRFKMYQSTGAGTSHTMLSDEKLSATGATGNKTATQSAAEASYGLNLILQK